MSDQTNIQTVQQAYEAFGRGDIQGVLDMLTQDVTWSMPGPAEIPHAGNRHGVAGAAEFFRLLNEMDEVLHFEPREFFTKDDKVAVLGRYRARARATGKVMDYGWAHIFTVQGGKISSFLEYCDTAAIAAAYRQEAAGAH